ncbi:unnamed protein product, partial [Mesorhabditis belari]|uniref:tRNA:m(4)X modification enzyme TRM13 n=1 Tax=Mesorhabditis belari TaxID=2138241 RepID=A0AAF3ESY0_9BILA
MAKEEIDEAQRCTYVLPRKKRKCRMLVKAGELFCGEHQIHNPENNDRIICPNDPNHTVAVSELEEHLRERCNARITLEPWIIEGLNAVKREVASFEPIDRRPNKEEIASVVARLLKMEEVDQFSQFSQLQCDKIQDFLDCHEELGFVQRKHLIQQASIIGHMCASDLLNNTADTSILELGAGKAQLAYWMAKVAPHARFLLVDRSGSRNKYDNKALQENPSLNLRRLRCSIEHLDLSKVEIIQNCQSLVAVQKHFCGSATDSGIRCLQNGITRGLDLKGFVLAPCCHHKMRYEEYIGGKFLRQQGFDGEADFSALRHISTWSVCGFEQTETERLPSEVTSELFENDWSDTFRARIGRRAKVLLEEGRVCHLKEFGYQVRLIEYVSAQISPENLLLLGSKE